MNDQDFAIARASEAFKLAYELNAQKYSKFAGAPCCSAFTLAEQILCAAGFDGLP